jgi:integral membrane protein (TIGR00529 family)
MIQFVALIAAFSCLTLMLRRKMEFGMSIFISALLLGALTVSGGLPALPGRVFVLLTRKTALQTMAAVLFVGILSGVCRHYGILDRIVHNLKRVVRNPRANLMLVPAIIGLMPVAGGAVMSVPFVDTIASEYDLSAERKSAINLVFRHAGMLLMPFSTMVMVSLSILAPMGIAYIDIASRTVVFVLLNLTFGYIFLLRDVPSRAPAQPEEGETGNGVFELFLNLSPILSVVLVAFVFGAPIYISVMVGILIAFLISDKKDFVKVMIKAANPKMLFTIAGINLMQGFIQDLDVVISQLTGFLGDGAGAVAAYALASVLLAFMTGSSLTSVSIVLPLLITLPQSHNMLAANTFLMFVVGYFGYYFSPLHLCQVLTLDYLKCGAAQLYREYRLYAICLLTTALMAYGIFALLA